MFIRIVVGAEIVAALMWAAPAVADPNSVVAVAINPQTGAAETAFGSGKPIDYAIQDAIEACNLERGPGCVYAGATANGCVGIAFYQGYFEWSARTTTSLAEQRAKSKLIADALNASGGNRKLNASGSNPVLYAACADGTEDGFSLEM
ncbi:MAG: DUF4189 domain-containing protein [Mycobacterium sp.]|uniref:DUF4189 domain-containing protein n=1 Tax=Mycobacterium sp. TaxID=1785 RepID=UPI003F97A836